MEGIWIKRCPGCGAYIKKEDPQAVVSCCFCGWNEAVPSYYCSLVNKFCNAMTAQDADKILASLVFSGRNHR